MRYFGLGPGESPVEKRTVLRNKLKIYRRKFGVTQQELADRLGIKKSYLSEIERGVYNPSTSLSLQIVGALEKIMKERSGGQQIARLRVDDVFYLEEGEAGTK